MSRTVGLISQDVRSVTNALASLFGRLAGLCAEPPGFS